MPLKKGNLAEIEFITTLSPLKLEYKSNPSKLFYIHVPKTAGTTLKTILIWLYKWDEIFWTKDIAYTKEKLEKLSSSQIEKLKVIAGHSPFGIHQHFNTSDYKYFTLIRDPVERVISHYYFIKRKPTNFLHKTVNENDLSLKDLIERDYFQLYNVQTYWLTGLDKKHFRKGVYDQSIVDLAIDNIKNHFALVGLNERFDESLILFKNLFGWSTPFYASKNVTHKSNKKANIPQETIDQIEHYNAMDVQVYNYCVEKFEEALSKHKNQAFEAELRKLQTLNQRIGVYKPYRLKLIKALLTKKLKKLITNKEYVDVLP